MKELNKLSREDLKVINKVLCEKLGLDEDIGLNAVIKAANKTGLSKDETVDKIKKLILDKIDIKELGIDGVKVCIKRLDKNGNEDTKCDDCNDCDCDKEEEKDIDGAVLALHQAMRTIANKYNLIGNHEILGIISMYKYTILKTMSKD